MRILTFPRERFCIDLTLGFGTFFRPPYGSTTDSWLVTHKRRTQRLPRTAPAECSTSYSSWDSRPRLRMVRVTDCRTAIRSLTSRANVFAVCRLASAHHLPTANYRLGAVLSFHTGPTPHGLRPAHAASPFGPALADVCASANPPPGFGAPPSNNNGPRRARRQREQGRPSRIPGSSPTNI
jgi:hypothetical protein